MSCGCEPGARACDFHYQLILEYRTTEAAVAGGKWAEATWRRVAPRQRLQPWPVMLGKVVHQAKEKVARWCMGDKRLLNRLSRTCWEAAAARWADLQHRARQRTDAMMRRLT